MDKLDVPYQDGIRKEYYIPDLEDIHIGYECEVTYLHKDDWLPIKVRHGEETESLIETVHNYNRRIRTPYLTKEQIEGEGWVYTGRSIDTWFSKEGSWGMGTWTARKLVMHYGEDQRLFIHVDDIGTDHPIFEGKCLSINEFRTISKLLGI